MARPALGGRTTCESCPSIDVREWQRKGLLHAGQDFSWSWTRGGDAAGSVTVRVEDAAVVLSCRSCRPGSSEWKSIQQRVPIRLTACHFGGVRPCFVCPAYCNGRYCGRRAAILYCAGELFACRQCHGLSYASQQQTALDRGLDRQDGSLSGCRRTSTEIGEPTGLEYSRLSSLRAPDCRLRAFPTANQRR